MPCSGLGHDQSLRDENDNLRARLAAAHEALEQAEAALAKLKQAATIYSDGHHRECQKAHYDDGPCGCGYDLLRKEMGWGNG